MIATPKKQHHETAAEDRIPLSEKLGLALGGLGCGAMGMAGQLLNFIFVMTMGMSTKLMGTVMFIQSLVNFFVGPLFGQFCDNFRSRWGRRRPLLLLTGTPVVLLGAAVNLFPRGLSENGLAIWLLVTWTLCSAFGSIYTLSLNALGIEATSDYHERTRLNFVLMLSALAFGLAVQWVFPLIKLPIFGDTIRGLRIVVGVSTCIFIVAIFAPVLLCPEKKYATLSKKAPKGNLFANMYEARKNGPFLVILSIQFFTFFCYTLVGVLGVFMNTYYIYGGDVGTAAKTYGVLGSGYCIAAAAAIFVYPHIARAWGKKASLQVAAGILIVDSLCKLVVYNPKYPYLQLIVLMANGISVQGINFTMMTMFGDIIDYDELLSGKRREALYASIGSWVGGIGGAFATLLSGYLLFWIGFDPKTGAQPQRTLDLMKLCYIVFPLIGGIFAVFMSTRYNLTEDRAYEIKDELKRRHAAQEQAGETEQAPVA